jgi:carbon monoxide dehydrogenase subunit G
MDMTGEHQINAPRKAVWAGLNDPEILKQSIPGCEEVKKLSESEMTAQVTAKVGPVKARFTGKIAFSEVDPANGYTLTGEGQGGAAGFAKGGAKVRLTDAPDGGTLLRYEVHSQIGGKLAQIGSRLVDGAARKMADDFFSAFAAAVEAQNLAGTATGLTASTGTAPTLSAINSQSGASAPGIVESSSAADLLGRRRSPAVWIGAGVVALGVAIWWAFTR